MLTMTDLFAGAGGSSTGAIDVPGVEVKLAANHWPKAVDVHNANHPDADHLCADISQVRPARVRAPHRHPLGLARVHQPLPGEGPPHRRHSTSRLTSSARPCPTRPPSGPGPPCGTSSGSPRSTGTAAIIVENVVDVAKWEPFQAWLAAMTSYGYDHQIVSLNSMHAQAQRPPRAAVS
jgi:DNA (cytosine-5)-methyltransferase 1